MILASAMILGTSVAAWSQGFKDDYAQNWAELEDDARAIELAGFFDHGSSCDGACDGGCDAGCDVSCEPKCCPPWWAHRTGVSAQWLYLRPGSTDLVYSIEQNNVPLNAFPTGPVGRTEIENFSGVRAGLSICASECTSLVLSFSHWEGDDESQIEASGGNILAPQVLHPSRISTGAFSLEDRATHGMDFQLAELAYRHLWRHSAKHAINWKAGLKYGNMEEEFRYDQQDAVAVGLVSLDTNIDFDGFGLMGGLDFERRSCKTGLSIYGSAVGSALAGDWNANYVDTTDQIGGGSIANEFSDFRITPLLELEVGLAWSSKCGRARVNAGFMTNSWYDALSSRSYINAVQAGQYDDVGETITFSGLALGGTLNF